MVAPLIGAALVSGASSLLGGLFGRSSNKYVVPNYQAIRDKAEAAGFNPLTALAMAPGQVVQSQNFMGSAIADAGLALADGMIAKHKEDGALAKLAEENDKLREKVQNMTLRPKVGGVYAQREAIPTLSQAVGGSNGQVSSGRVSTASAGASAAVGSGDNGSTVGPDGLLTKDAVDPRRGVDNMKVTTDPGYAVIDNPMLGAPFRVPALQGEIIETDQIPTVLGAWALDRAYKAWNKPADPPARYTSPPMMRPSDVARVIPNRQPHVNADSSRSQAAVRSAIKAVDPSYDDRPSSPYWHQYRVKPFTLGR